MKLSRFEKHERRFQQKRPTCSLRFYSIANSKKLELSRSWASFPTESMLSHTLLPNTQLNQNVHNANVSTRLSTEKKRSACTDAASSFYTKFHPAALQKVLENVACYKLQLLFNVFAPRLTQRNGLAMF